MTLRTLARQLEKMDDLHKHQLMTEARACQPLGIILCKLSIKNTIQDNTKEVFFYPPQLKEQMRQSTLNILNSPVLTGKPWKPLPHPTLIIIWCWCSCLDLNFPLKGALILSMHKFFQVCTR